MYSENESIRFLDRRHEGCTFLYWPYISIKRSRRSAKHHLIRVRISRRVQKSSSEVVKVSLEHRKVLLKCSRPNEVGSVVEYFDSDFEAHVARVNAMQEFSA